MAIVMGGIDPAKNVVAVHGVIASGKRDQNDAADAAAICEAITRSGSPK